MQFFNYFRAVLTSPRHKATPIALWVAAYFLFFLGIYVGRDFITSFGILAGIVMCYYFSSTPNFEKVFPANHKKKLAYRFLSVLLMWIAMLAAIIAFFFVIFVIVALIVSATEGGFGWIVETGPDEEDLALFNQIGVYGGLFGVAYFIIMYSAGMITGFIQKRKTRNIWLACLCCAVALSYVLMSVPYILDGGLGLASPFSQTCYVAMSLPWLSIIFWFIIAFGMLGTAIYMGIKHYDPKR